MTTTDPDDSAMTGVDEQHNGAPGWSGDAVERAAIAYIRTITSTGRGEISPAHQQAYLDARAAARTQIATHGHPQLASCTPTQLAALDAWALPWNPAILTGAQDLFIDNTIRTCAIEHLLREHAPANQSRGDQPSPVADIYAVGGRETQPRLDPVRLVGTCATEADVRLRLAELRAEPFGVGAEWRAYACFDIEKCT
ncbi:hypothetical protein [Nocardia suismassiliense]|uniref:hypothetical protein n=1 Tax=Nocardia suismassiliense TaxID=2077092 RepID=UPI000D1FD131|nr:hypothetical protein [Nocardia suismassiliense]